MKSFKIFLNEGTSTLLTEAVSAAAFEATITTAYNGGPNKDPKTLESARIKLKDYQTVEKQSKKIAKLIRAKTGAKGKMIHFGTGAGKRVSWWTGGGVPKSDMYIGKVHISLKQSGGSQLMSARRGEALSTFRAAIEYMQGEEPQETAKLVKLIEKSMIQFFTPKGVNINSFKFILKQFKKKGPRGIKKAVRDKIDEFNAIDKAVREVVPKLGAFMEENIAFRTWFVYEAATGETKFGPDPFADANWIVEFNPATGHAKVEKLSNGKRKPAKFIKILAAKVGFKLRWKTGSGSKLNKQGVGNTEMSLRVDVPAPKKGERLESWSDTLTMLGLDPVVTQVPTTSTLEDIYTEELRLFAEEGDVYLTEEGFIRSVVSFFKGLWDKIIAGLRAAGAKGILWVLDFLGIELTGIEPTNLEFNLGA